jgi:hypothetical protein
LGNRPGDYRREWLSNFVFSDSTENHHGNANNKGYDCGIEAADKNRYRGNNQC